MKKPLKRPMLMLTLLAAPALALAARQAVAAEIAVHQTPAKPVPTITIPARSLLSARIIVDEFRVLALTRGRVTLESAYGRPIVVTQPARTSLHVGEIVTLTVTSLRGQP